MKRAIFKGEKTDLGRFGVIASGTTLELRESEWDDVRDDSRFKLLEAKVSEEERERLQSIKPYGTSGCDLRRMPWEKPNLPKILLARFSKRKLFAVIESMRFVGAEVRPIELHTPRVEVVDAILESIRAMGWDQLTAQERWRLPSFADRPRSLESKLPVDEAPDSAESSASREDYPAVALPRPRKRIIEKKKAS